MRTDLAHWLPGSFFRKPEWRLLRAEHLIATGRRRDPRIDDDWVCYARAALRGRRGGLNVAAVAAARQIWAGDPAVKGELEARLLTEEPLDNVAERLLLSPAVVGAYAEVFFAVRPMRRATDWVLARAVGYSPLRGFTAELPYAAWKLAAFAGGLPLFDVVVAATTGGPLPAEARVANDLGSGRDARTRLLARTWVEAMNATSVAEHAAVLRARRLLNTDPACRPQGGRVPVSAAEDVLSAIGDVVCGAVAGKRNVREPADPTELGMVFKTVARPQPDAHVSEPSNARRASIEDELPRATPVRPSRRQHRGLQVAVA